MTDVERQLEDAILELLGRRAEGATICPSEAARAVSAGSWRELMDASRAAAGRLAHHGLVEITQGGEPVDIREARGPVRIRKVESGSPAG